MGVGIRAFLYLCVKQLVPVIGGRIQVSVASFTKQRLDSQLSQMVEIDEHDRSLCWLTADATHTVYVVGKTLTEAGRDLAQPGQEVATLAFFSQASALDRPRRSVALLYQQELYFVLNWSDVLDRSDLRRNKRHLRKPKDALRVFINGSYALHLRKATSEAYDLVAAELSKFQASGKTNVCGHWR